MKHFITIFLVINISIFSYGQNKIKKLEVKETGYEVAIEIIPKINKVKCDNNISIEITPVSPETLNDHFFSKNQLDGKYHYSYYDKSRDSYFLKKTKVKSEKSDYEFIIEGLDLLLENEVIDQNEYAILYNSVTLDFNTYINSEQIPKADNISNNPYYLNNKYMNVFRLEITNSSNSFAIYDDQLSVKYNNNLYQPLTSAFLKNELITMNQMTNAKSLILERFNYISPIIIPPLSTIVKYFSVLPIDFSSEDLIIYSNKYNKSLSWSVNIKQTDINRSYSFFELHIEHTYAGSSASGKDYTLLSTANPSSIFFDGDKLFVASDATGDVFQLITFSISYDKLYFSRMSNLSAKNYLDLSKNKRIPIKTESFLIDQVKKK
jgi:hypothetical protein